MKLKRPSRLMESFPLKISSAECIVPMQFPLICGILLELRVQFMLPRQTIYCKGFIVTMTIIFAELISTAVPRYKQIADQIAKAIESGELAETHRLPTHRALADQLSVTVGTVTRGYAELERRGLIEARVGAGTYVRARNSGRWAFDSLEEDTQQCHLDYNIPPFLDRADMLNRAMHALAKQPEVLNQSMLYQQPEGFLRHRQVFADWLQRQGVALTAERLLFCSGAQHAIQMALGAYCRAGDTLLVEKHTYPGMISLARQKQLTLKPVEMDDEGLLPDALDTACRRYQPRLLYCMPTLQNPTTSTMSLVRRKAILDVCYNHDLYVVEDQVNGLLPEQRPEPLVNLAPELVIHLGALSKCLAPGLRVGYLQAPKVLHQRMINTLQNHSWMISPLLTGIACELIRTGDAEKVLVQIRQEMKARQMITDHYLSEFGARTADGCFHVWLPMPGHLHLSDFIAVAAERGVILKSSEFFSPPSTAMLPAARLSISAPDSHKALERGLSTLREILQQEARGGFSL